MLSCLISCSVLTNQPVASAVAAGTAKPTQLPSQAGGLHEMPGSAATQSQAVTCAAPADGKRKAGADAESSPPLDNFWVDGTQPSQAGAALVANKVCAIQLAFLLHGPFIDECTC
jgi:hypothetical protein